MESDVKRSEQARLLATVSPPAFCVRARVTSPALTACFQQKGEGTCLGSVLTAADAAYLSCSGHLTSHEEGEALAAAAVVHPEPASFFFFCGVHMLLVVLFVQADSTADD